MKQVDKSPILIQILATISAWLAKQRGLPIVVGIIFVAIGGVLELANVVFANQVIEVVEIIFRNFGLITALVGIALLEPLGT